MKRVTAISLICVATSAVAEDAFPYDKGLATELAQAYLQSFSRESSGAFVMSGLGKPLVTSAVAAKGRRLVFVSYAIAGKPGGAYVELELCAETKLLTVVDVGTVDQLGEYREEHARINSKVFVASPAVCPEELP